MPIDPSTAFVSYAREDLEFVLRLAKDLKTKGAKVWMDRLDIRLGQRWELEVESALNGCSRMLVIVSPASIASKNVLAEAAYAIDEGKEVIPVVIKEVKIPFRLRPFQYADLSADYAAGLDELLANLMGGPESAASTPTGQARLEEEHRQAAAEQARLEEERKQAEADKARQEQLEHERLAAEEKARQQELERKRVAAEQARLEEVRRQAEAKKTRQEQLERERKATEEEEKLRCLPENLDRSFADCYHKAQSGDSAAMVALATAYANGNGTSKDFNEAMSWFRKAADAGDPQGMRGLGYMYFSGSGVKRDYFHAIQWFRKAAESGDTNAMCNLGVSYRDGLGATQDYGQAENWYRKAAEAGNTRGMTGLAFLYLKGYGVAKDYREAIGWYRAAADLGDRDASDALKQLGEAS